MPPSSPDRMSEAVEAPDLVTQAREYVALHEQRPNRSSHPVSLYGRGLIANLADEVERLRAVVEAARAVREHVRLRAAPGQVIWREFDGALKSFDSHGAADSGGGDG